MKAKIEIITNEKSEPMIDASFIKRQSSKRDIIRTDEPTFIDTEQVLSEEVFKELIREAKERKQKEKQIFNECNPETTEAKNKQRKVSPSDLQLSLEDRYPRYHCTPSKREVKQSKKVQAQDSFSLLLRKDADQNQQEKDTDVDEDEYEDNEEDNAEEEKEVHVEIQQHWGNELERRINILKTINRYGFY